MEVLRISAGSQGSRRIEISDVPLNRSLLNRVLPLGGMDIHLTSAPVEACEEVTGKMLSVQVSSPGIHDLEDISIELTAPQSGQTVFVNGFQSWTRSREYLPNESIRGIRPLPGRIFKLRDIGDYHFAGYTGKPGRFHSYTYTYFRNPDGSIDFWGSLGEESGYTIFHIDMRNRKLMIKKDCAGMSLEEMGLQYSIVHLQGTEDQVFTRYARHLGIPPRSQTVTGWTSWYNYYTRISEEIILENLAGFAKFSDGGGVFQIDDGYETRVGDWLSIKPAFPRGMKFLAGAIRDKGFTPGLWLSPFLCERKSHLAREHGDWILRDKRGRKVTAGWIPLWSGKTYALDIYNEEFRAYLQKVFRTVLDEWGYGITKLDFLYAAAMIPHHGKNRGQIMADGCRLLRELVGDRPILGCGVPLGSCFNLFEYCRIGSDVGPKWEDGLLRFFRYRERVSTLNSLMSTIGRRHLGGRIFVNDPDVFILRKEKNDLSEDHKYTLFLLNNLFGQLVFTSDNVALYDEQTAALYRSMFPLELKQIIYVEVLKQVYTISFSIGNRHYLVYANLSPRKKNIRLEEGEYYRGQTLCRAGGPLSGGRELFLAAGESLCLLRLDDAVPTDANMDTLFPGSGR